MKMHVDWKKKMIELNALRDAVREKMGATLTQEGEAKLKEELWHLEQQLSELERARPESADIQEDELVKLAQISMSQAIQIATAQQPGTVVECRLQGNLYEGREHIYYCVWVRYVEGAENAVARLTINAIDGSYMGRVNKR